MDTSLVLNAGVLPTYTAQGNGVPVPTRAAERPLEVTQPIGEPFTRRSALSGGYGQLRARQDDLNEMALAIRREGAKVEIRKLFPPYPPDQEARMDYLDQVSGLRKQIEALMGPAGQNGALGVASNAAANDSAADLSQESRRLLAALTSQQAISVNRPLLEGLAQMDPVQ